MMNITDSAPLLQKNSSSQENGKEVGKAQHLSYAVQLVTSVSLPMVLYTAVKLKLFEIIAKAGHAQKLSAAQIASQLPTKNPAAAAPMLDRMLLLLSSHSVLTCDVVLEAEAAAAAGGGGLYERVYGLAPVGEFFVPDEEGSSVGHMLELIQNKILIDSWYELENAVLEGGGAPPFERVHGMDIYEYAGKDPRLNETIIKGVVGLTTTIVKHLLTEYKGFEHLQTLVDVGGGPGIVLHHITSKYPSIKAINFDLPHVVKNAPSFPGVEHIGGDMFESVPGAEAIFMKDIMHDWSDDHCLRVLKNCFKALPGAGDDDDDHKGKVIVVEFVLPAKPDTSASSKKVCQTDLLMLTQNSGGKERSEQEFRALAIAAGFRRIKFQYLSCDVGVIEMYK